MTEEKRTLAIIPAEPGTYTLYDDAGRLYVGNRVIAWRIEEELDMPESTLTATPVYLDDYYYQGFLFPDGRVEFGYGETFKSLGEARLYVLEAHLCGEHI